VRPYNTAEFTTKADFQASRHPLVTGPDYGWPSSHMCDPSPTQC